MSQNLLHAIQSGDIATAEELLLSGADPNWISDCNPLDSIWTPLKEAICAVSEGESIALVELLLRHGAKVNGVGMPGEITPLLGAVYMEEVSAVELLLAHNANPNLFDSTGDSPLRVSVEQGNLTIARMLLEKDATHTIDSWGGPSAMTALGRAAWSLNLDMIKLLIDAGADLSARDGDGLRAWERLPSRDTAEPGAWEAAATMLGLPK